MRILWRHWRELRECKEQNGLFIKIYHDKIPLSIVIYVYEDDKKQ